MAQPISSLSFTVRRREPELITPAMPTPHEFKLLSDIDDQEGLRFQVPIINFYRGQSQYYMDPVKVIKEALAQTLVFYYPFAGRLREMADRKLVVECTGEGVMFIEADADVRLEDFGDALRPPVPCLEELLFDVPGSGGILNCPLLLIQVTRLACGGFVFALRFNHTMSDAAGIVQFMIALAQIARGAHVPSVPPVWKRELLDARGSHHLTCIHHEYDQVTSGNGAIIPPNEMVERSFFFGPTEIRALRRFVPHHLRECSRIEVLTACLWRCRTRALQLDPEEEVRVCLLVNARSKFNPPMPVGYYGNAFAYPAALTTAGKLCHNPMGYALELVKKIKGTVTEEYMRSVAELMVIKGRPLFTIVGNFILSDLTRAGFENVDFGWGKAVYAGLGKAGLGDAPGGISFYVRLEKKNGEIGIVVPICLPALVMDKFVIEVDNMLKDNHQSVTNKSPPKILSPL